MNSAIIHAGQLVTLAGPNRPRVGTELAEVGILKDGAVIMENGRIWRVGTTDDLRHELAKVEEVHDANGMVVTPGLVDAHTHLVFAGNRASEFEARCAGKSYIEIAAEGGGIQSTVKMTREADEDTLLAESQRHLDWMLRCGTTTAESKSGYGLTLEDELKILRVSQRLNQDGPARIVPTFLGAHSVPAEFRSNPEGYHDLLVNSMLPEVRQQGLAEWCDIFCESIAFDLDSSHRILSAAKDLGFKLRMHVDQLTSGGGAELAASLGAKTADHLEMVSAEGIRALAAAGVTPVLLPGSVYALGHQTYPPARAMIEAGLPVVLATDFNPGSSPTPSLPMVMSLACTQMGMTPTESLVACTVNAAHSLDLGDEIGSLEVGKNADLVQWSCRDYREISYFFGHSLAVRSWIAGVELQLETGAGG